MAARSTLANAASPGAASSAASSLFPAFGIDQHRGEVGRSFVARGAGHGPARWERLVGREDLLDHDERVGDEVAEPAQVRRGIGEPVDVVDTQSVDDPGVPQFGDQRVRRGEDVRVLDAHAGQVGDVEEPPVVHERRAGPPVLEPVVLRRERLGEGGSGCADEWERLVVVAHHSFAAPGDVHARARRTRARPRPVRRARARGPAPVRPARCRPDRRRTSGRRRGRRGAARTNADCSSSRPRGWARCRAGCACRRRAPRPQAARARRGLRARG